MKLKTIKTQAELCEAVGVPNSDGFVELLTLDSAVIGARIGQAHFAVDSYSFKASRIVEHEEAERYRVRVDHPHFPSLNRYFESQYGEGQGFRSTYEKLPDTTIDAKTVTVQLDGNGRVIAELDESGAVCPLTPQENGGDDIPF